MYTCLLTRANSCLVRILVNFARFLYTFRKKDMYKWNERAGIYSGYRLNLDSDNKKMNMWK